ncbi:hypothetical protein [uncultured Ruegeria sp.]|uniref:hypothetical protein n=1 Tax=uncultured Ruegeria sp. TaxID=259304 RepID=UPI00262920BF|nr:hypothetical protein [uncultured Ruegeria sp.]
MAETEGAKQVVKDLAEGFSLYAKLSNRLWLSLVTVLAVVVLPETQLTEDGGAITKSLPFGLGIVEKGLFDVLAFFTMCALAVSYSSARANAMLAYDLAHKAIDQIADPDKSIVTQRQFFDIMSYPTLLRVGPISVITRLRFKNRKSILLMSSWMYAIVKNMGVIITYAIPLYAIFYSYYSIAQNLNVWSWVMWVAFGTGMLASLAMVQVLLSDIVLTLGVFRRLSSSNDDT